MKPLDYVIELLDADPHGWKEEGNCLCHKRCNINIWLYPKSRLEVRGDVEVKTNEFGFFGKRRLYKAIERQESAVLAQKLLDATEGM